MFVYIDTVPATCYYRITQASSQTVADAGQTTHNCNSKPRDGSLIQHDFFTILNSGVVSTPIYYDGPSNSANIAVWLQVTKWEGPSNWKLYESVRQESNTLYHGYQNGEVNVLRISFNTSKETILPIYRGSHMNIAQQWDLLKYQVS